MILAYSAGTPGATFKSLFAAVFTTYTCTNKNKNKKVYVI